MFARAGQPELVRSNQKDVYYLGFLREGIGQIYRNFQGKTMCYGNSLLTPGLKLRRYEDENLYRWDPFFYKHLKKVFQDFLTNQSNDQQLI